MLQASPADESIEVLRDTSAALFVINLCASTTPVTLSHPASADLKRFTFFVTRRREEGRERFRLHMGYFPTLTEAEAMLAAVRDVYPAAWAGPAPENRSAPSRAAAKPAISVVPAVVDTTPPVIETQPTVAVELVIEAKAIAVQPVIELALVVEPPPPTPPTPPVVAAPVELASMSNVREVLDALTDEPKAPTAAPAPIPPRVGPRPVAKPAAPKIIARKPAVPVPAPVARKAPVETAALSASETLRVLESPPVESASSSTANNIRVLTPEDTQTLRDIKLDAQRNAPASYAVQLVWAVQPIDMESLPHLAIFDAYTLYHVEGNRQGRRWYGLRLGFFTDAGAAKQVAQYVRSEYASVAIVPVTGKERDGARAPTLSAAALQQSAAPRNEAPKIPTVKALEKPAPGANVEGFELLPDAPAAAKRDLTDFTGKPAAKVPPRATGKAPGKRAVARPNRKPPPGASQPLESTLEILGASTLTIDESREIINDAADRKQPLPKKGQQGRFSRLLNRLSDRGAKS